MAAATSIYNAPDGSFIKAVRKPGTGYFTPTEGSVCKIIVSIVSREEVNGLNFGQLVTGEEAEIVIGEADTDVCDIIDKCVMSMRKDEVGGLLFPVIDGHVVSGKDTQNATFVTLEVTLVDFTRDCLLWHLDARQKLQHAQRHKDRGSEMFKSGSKEAAFKRYSCALRYVISICSSHKDGSSGVPTDVHADCTHLQNQLYLNMAACQMQYDNYNSVIVNCSKALVNDSANVKGLYRRGVAYSRLRDWQNASADLQAVVNLEKGNKAALRELQTVQQMLHEQRENEKLGQLARGMRQMFS